MSESGEGVVNVQISVDQSEIDAAIASIDTSTLGKEVKKGVKVSGSVKSSKEVGSEIKGLETAVHRVARMIPYVREVDRTYKALHKLDTGNIMGAVGLVLIAWRLIRMIGDYYEKIERQKREFEQTIREAQGYTTHERYAEWQSQQKAGMEAARLRNITR
jgi:hypothetical protein